MKLVFHVTVITFCILWVIKEILAPTSAAAIYSNAYMASVVECDTAMEAAWYGDSSDPNEVRAQDIHLLECHTYDKLRKKMLFMGLSEDYLSWLGLKSLDIYQRPASEVSEQHRFKER
ncbi:TIGR03982 family His-Xaa-Ser system protein [Luminiphilus sp.]|nr:TIGR03982 family His-Xaa-Ser system protein [Luminiphilus sp.]